MSGSASTLCVLPFTLSVIFWAMSDLSPLSWLVGIWNETNPRARPGRGGPRTKANGTAGVPAIPCPSVVFETYLMRAHRQPLQAQLADRAAIDRLKVRLRDMSLGEPRQQPRDRDRDRGAAEDVADAVMRAGAERQNPLGLAMDVEPQRIGEHVGI